MVPRSLQSAEYCAWPTATRVTSLTVMYWTKSPAWGPRTVNSPMWETSKRPAAVRTAACSARMPVGYCTGMAYPAKGTILPPRAVWTS